MTRLTSRLAVVMLLVGLMADCGGTSDGPARGKLKPQPFASGRKVVGVDIAPGTYRSEGGEGCRWERLKGLSGAENDDIVEQEVTGQTIVTIEQTDKGFNSEFCGPWTPASVTPISDRRIGEGLHVVGADVVAGTYRAPGGRGCHWERLSSVTGASDETIANADPVGATFVIINADDKAFRTRHCGIWRQIA